MLPFRPYSHSESSEHSWSLPIAAKAPPCCKRCHFYIQLCHPLAFKTLKSKCKGGPMGPKSKKPKVNYLHRPGVMVRGSPRQAYNIHALG